MKILVLGGGQPPEREISFRSAKNVDQALKRAGFATLFFDPKAGVEGLLELAEKADLVFPILHGPGGEDGTIQAVLEKHRIKYLGSKPQALKNTIDKTVLKKLCVDNQIKTPRWKEVDLRTLHESGLVKKPFVLKPIKGGSAIDAFIIRRLPVDFSTIDKTIAKHKKMLLEEFIEGKEIAVGILDGRALPVVEIIPPKGEEFDFINRYNGRTQELCPPISIPEYTQKKTQETALKVHKIAGCRHLSRIDMIIRKDQIYVLELNSIPGMTNESLYPKEAQAAGMSFEDLVKELVNLVLKEV